MAEPLVFIVPLPPTLTNSGAGRSRHWRALEREKRAYWKTLDILASWAARRTEDAGVVEWRIPPAPDEPFARVDLTSAMVLHGAMDDDNAMARHKWLLDWLVAHGYCASDRRTCVRWTALPGQVVRRLWTPRITQYRHPQPPAP